MKKREFFVGTSKSPELSNAVFFRDKSTRLDVLLVNIGQQLWAQGEQLVRPKKIWKP
jgi:hypothetical protein